MGTFEFIGFGILGAMCWDLLKWFARMLWQYGSNVFKAIVEAIGDSTIS